MNIKFITYILGWILNFQSGFLFFTYVVSLFMKEKSGVSFLISAIICIVAGLALTFRKPKEKAFYAKDGFIAVALGWIVLSITGALPFIISGEIPSVFDALFETISGYTTTGATVVNSVEGLSNCMNFWRCFTHWIGGMGILVFVLCIIPLAGGNNMHLMRAESPGPSVGKLVPRVHTTALILYGIYTAMTIIQIILLLLGGMSVFDAVTTSFATAGTGGFGIKNDSMAGYSIYIQNVVAVFMVLFGVNFTIYFLVLVGKAKEIFKSEELKAYIVIIFVATIIIGFNISGAFPSLGKAMQQSFFQVSSIITTTGFSTTDFNKWPALSKSVLVGLMFIGACAGSTGGGIKVSRIVIAWKNIKNEIASFIHPKSVKIIHMDNKKVKSDIAKSVNTYLVLYFFIFAVSVILISIEGFSLETNFTAVAATLNNIGPGLDLVGPMDNFAKFNPFSKCVFMFDMLAGRLELIPMVILFSPSLWKER